jgi:methyl-accepting chemotaxis protein
MDNNTTQTLLMVFVGITSVSFLIQAGVMVAMAVGARKTQKKVMALAEDVRLHALPAIMSSRELVSETSPKIKSILEDLSSMSSLVKGKTEQISTLVGDVTDRAQVQTARVDGMVKGTLDGLTSAVQAIEHGVAGPVRQVNGLINGLKAGVEVLRSKTPAEPTRVQESEADLFV